MLDNKFFPLVSIVIPTYNHANYLGRALQSVLDQTYKNWEAIVIDNHSTDDTSKVIDKYKHPRIKYIKISNQGVIAKSRNAGRLAAKG
jgi:glycosyltransferase involved in cell wall biosynthesis